jgi:solute carrier family 25 citrate transporter 1
MCSARSTLSVIADEYTHRIDDRKSASPRMRSTTHAITLIFHEHGIRGILRGLVPTTAKQAANSAVRFTSYSTIRDIWQRRLPHGQKPDSIATFTIGGLAGLITVYATQPLDVIKTRMQSLQANLQYRNSLDATVKIVRNEGVLTLWSGAVPRLARLIVSKAHIGYPF